MKENKKLSICVYFSVQLYSVSNVVTKGFCSQRTVFSLDRNWRTVLIEVDVVGY